MSDASVQKPKPAMQLPMQALLLQRKRYAMEARVLAAVEQFTAETGVAVASFGVLYSMQQSPIGLNTILCSKSNALK